MPSLLLLTERLDSQPGTSCTAFAALFCFPFFISRYRRCAKDRLRMIPAKPTIRRTMMTASPPSPGKAEAVHSRQSPMRTAAMISARRHSLQGG